MSAMNWKAKMTFGLFAAAALTGLLGIWTWDIRWMLTGAVLLGLSFFSVLFTIVPD